MLFWRRTPARNRSGLNQKAEPLRNQFRTTASCRPNHSLSTLLVLVMTCVVQFAISSDGFADTKTGTSTTDTKPNPVTDAQPAAQAEDTSGVKTGKTPSGGATSGQPKSVDAKTGAQKLGSPKSGAPKSGGKVIPLPKNVADMRHALLAAAQSAKIEDLRTPYEWNELPPAISDEKIDDPIAYWKKVSRDGRGLEVLLIIDKLLNLPPAKLNVGSDVENSALYVWPYLAELDLSKLTPRQQFELRTLVPPKEARKIMDTKKWSWWRLAIGADGTWHSFMKHDR